LTKLETLSRAGFWTCVLIIAVLSLVPGTIRPHTGTSGHFEHFIAYAGTGFLFALATSQRARIGAALGLAAMSGALELLQLTIPGRSPELCGFFSSSLGAWLGLLAGAIAWSLWLDYRTRRA
jgi:VanZ family protein